MARRGKLGFGKDVGYLNRVFTVEYDLNGMLKAYGPEFIHWLVDEITAGRIDTRQCVDRWAADKHITSSFASVQADYAGDDASYAKPEDTATDKAA